jgi:polysaccharide biosynthesis/export protein
MDFVFYLKNNIMKNQTLSIITVLFLITGCTTQKKLAYLGTLPATGEMETFPMNIPAYRIKPSDVLYVTVKAMGPDGAIRDFLSGGNSMNMNITQGDAAGLYGYDVNSEGNIILPAIGAIHINGLTLEETRKAIQEPVDKVFMNATVECKLLSFKYTVIGEVRSPGTYNQYSNYLTILEAVGRAGGLTDIGNRNRVLVVRPVDKGTKTFRVNLQDNNIFTSEVYTLLPNDVIIVEPLKQKALSLSIPTISSIIGIISTTLFLITFLTKY